MEVNLLYQIRSRFSEFLEMMLKLNQMEEEITACHQRVMALRKFSKGLKDRFVVNGLMIIKKKKKYIKIQKTLQIVSISFSAEPTNLTFA